MGKQETIYAMAIVALTATCVLLIQSTANAQLTSYHTNNAEINYVEFTLTIYNPSNKTYNKEMPLNFTVYWDRYPTFSGLPSPPAPVMEGSYSYTIDNMPTVNVVSINSSSDIYDGRGFKRNPTFQHIIDISSLSAGFHSIVITANIHGKSGSISFTDSSSPIVFSVGEISSTPTATSVSPTSTSDSIATNSPTVASSPPKNRNAPHLELSDWILTFIPLIVAIIVLASITILTLRRHRNTANLRKIQSGSP